MEKTPIKETDINCTKPHIKLLIKSGGIIENKRTTIHLKTE